MGKSTDFPFEALDPVGRLLHLTQYGRLPIWTGSILWQRFEQVLQDRLSGQQLLSNHVGLWSKMSLLVCL